MVLLINNMFDSLGETSMNDKVINDLADMTNKVCDEVTL